MGCCVEGELTQVSARSACTDSIRSAIDQTLNEDIFGVLVDALPTLGKSRTVATIADDLRSLSSDGTPKITILTHRRETRNQIEGWAAEAGFDPHQLPRFDSDCPTANGEFGDEWRDRVHDIRERGISPGRLHSDPSYDLPCSEDRTCPYVEGWEDSREHDVLVGHPTHAYVPEVVRDRVVVFDEDPGEAFRVEFDSNTLHRVVSEYLAETEEVSWITDDTEKIVQSVDQLKSYRDFGPEEQIHETLSALRSRDLFGDASLVGDVEGHGAARAATLALLEKEREDLGNGAERIDLPGTTVAVYDEVEGRLYIRRPPDLSSTAGLVGLDGTPVVRLWEGRLGCPSEQGLEYERVLCEECRSHYLQDVLGYRVYQTSTHVKPYSSGRNVNTEKDLALIEAVYRETGQEPAVISTKTAIETLENEWSHVQDFGHYGAIKGTNRFSGGEVEVGIVVGSQHPGDHEIKRLAGLNGDRVTFPDKRIDRGKALTYGVEPLQEEPADPYLTHFREHQVVQAIFRFGRRDGAEVFVHTGAVPDWIVTGEPIESEKEIFKRARSAGEREVVDALEEGGSMTAAEVIEEVEIAQRTVYDRLDDLQDDGLVEKIGSSPPYSWRLVDTAAGPDDTHLVNDEWYVALPKEFSSSAD